MGAIEDHGLSLDVSVDDDMATATLKRGAQTAGEIETLYVPEIDAYRVSLAYTREFVPKKQGIGREMYDRLNAEVKRQGKKLASDLAMRQSDDAKALWRSMVSKGVAKGPLPWPGKEGDARHTYHMMELWKDKLSGGLADKMAPGEFDPDQLKKGIEHELEHTDDRKTAEEIAMDHLSEDPRYYDHLKEMSVSKRVLMEMFGVKSEAKPRPQAVRKPTEQEARRLAAFGFGGNRAEWLVAAPTADVLRLNSAVELVAVSSDGVAALMPNDEQDGHVEWSWADDVEDSELMDALYAMRPPETRPASDFDFTEEGKEQKLGSGARFKKLAGKLAHQKGVTDPSALAASIGRKKHGAGKMAKMAAAGRKHEGSVNEDVDLVSQFEDMYPDGDCPKKWIVKLFKTHGHPDVDAAWREYAQDTGAPPAMPERVEWRPVLEWMGY